MPSIFALLTFEILNRSLINLNFLRKCPKWYCSTKYYEILLTCLLKESQNQTNSQKEIQDLQQQLQRFRSQLTEIEKENEKLKLKVRRQMGLMQDFSVFYNTVRGLDSGSFVPFFYLVEN